MRIVFFLVFISYGYFYNIASESIKLSEKQRNEIANEVKYLITDFTSYLPEIAASSNKSIEKRKIAKRYKEKALKLFIGEGKPYPYLDINGNERMHAPVSIQITSDGKNSSMPITRYLDRLMSLPYHTVKVDSCQAIWISDYIYKQDENKWISTAYFLQPFRAYDSEGYCIFNDYTPTKITVFFEREEVFDPRTGHISTYETVRLGDISVHSDYKYPHSMIYSADAYQ
ncbi:MAG: hypothetical protein K2K37_04625 [Muribaculaceae bacterium]|nr:hypothetical protein [Muribaculaceae bacterium]